MQPEFDKGKKLGRIEANLANPEPVMRVIGALVVSESERAFEDQRHDGRRWSARAVPNVYGIIADLAGPASAPAGRRFDSRPALVDTGRLRSSIDSDVVNNGRTAVIGTTVDYAAVHQFGGRIESETISATVQQKLGRWLRGQGAQFRNRLAFLLSPSLLGKKLQGTVEARPFLGLTDRTIAQAHRAIGVEIFEVK